MNFLCCWRRKIKPHQEHLEQILTYLNNSADNAEEQIKSYLASLEPEIIKDIKAQYNNNLLHIFALDGRLSLVKYILDNQLIDPQEKNSAKLTPYSLVESCLEDNTEIPVTDQTYRSILALLVPYERPLLVRESANELIL